MIICDTNIIIDMLKNKPATVSELQRIGAANLCVSVVTKSELIFGALNKADLTFILKGISRLPVLPTEVEIGESAVRLMERYCLSNKLSLPDSLIAATALYHNLPLFTLNRKDFRYIPELRLYEPTPSA